MKTDRLYGTRFETRHTDDDTGQIVGYASVFDKPSLPLGWSGFIEQVRKGAFAKTITEADVRALFNHSPDWVLGRNKAGTLDLAEDDTGLLYDITIDQRITQSRDVFLMIQRGDISQSSFGFTVIKEEWNFPDEGSDDPITRTIFEARLFDVSPVTWPAYPDTSVETNDFFSAMASQLEMPVDQLREAGSGPELRSIIAGAVVEPPVPPETVEGTPRLDMAKRHLQLRERSRR